jgi:hypothetical protein
MQSAVILRYILLGIAQILGESLDEKPKSVSGQYSLIFILWKMKSSQLRLLPHATAS